ncbi:WYL domain-containing protein, partial [Streptomyces flavofungini]|uniref:WYL domain-containing protein n=1 Tax=Streptomyces flavofungini TaxID=68200 RepID=UPI0034DE1B4C
LKAGVWYLCARVPDHDTHRVYRIDRFTEITPGAERFVRDERFDLPAFWEERAAEFARAILRSEVVVRLTESGVRQLPYATDRAVAREAMESAGAPDAAGRVTVTLPVENEDVAYTQLMALGPHAEILAPATLRARFAAAAALSARLYAPTGPPTDTGPLTDSP